MKKIIIGIIIVGSFITGLLLIKNLENKPDINQTDLPKKTASFGKIVNLPDIKISPAAIGKSSTSITANLGSVTAPDTMTTYSAAAPNITDKEALVAANIFNVSGKFNKNDYISYQIYEWKQGQIRLGVTNNPPNINYFINYAGPGSAVSKEYAKNYVLQTIKKFQNQGLIDSKINTAITGIGFLKYGPSVYLAVNNIDSADATGVSAQFTIDSYPIYLSKTSESDVSASVSENQLRKFTMVVPPLLSKKSGLSVVSSDVAIDAVLGGKGVLIEQKWIRSRESTPVSPPEDIILKKAFLAYFLFEKDWELKPVYIFKGGGINKEEGEKVSVTYMVPAFAL